MKHNFKTLVFLLLLHTTFSAHSSKSSGASDVSTPPPTTPHPITVKLEQLQMMEESSLTGWYQVVNKFLEIIKPDHRILEDVINFATGKHDLNPQEFVLKVAKNELCLFDNDHYWCCLCDCYVHHWNIFLLLSFLWPMWCQRQSKAKKK
ncbi:hypothetical protein CEXT_742351 [Caerostris extrusa]|uniref:Uncharacterized protein n=1 Tax=Caerostris extrusa TaxID=172846 RepID=A0AAV4TXC6_CAEEX|nr:hypothetical protein CEXT_742351 [Caerostris extrusa]